MVDIPRVHDVDVCLVGRGQDQGVVDLTAHRVSRGCLSDGVQHFAFCESDRCERPCSMLNGRQGIGRMDTGHEWQCRQRRVQLGQRMRGADPSAWRYT